MHDPPPPPPPKVVTGGYWWVGMYEWGLVLGVTEWVDKVLLFCAVGSTIQARIVTGVRALRVGTLLTVVLDAGGAILIDCSVSCPPEPDENRDGHRFSCFLLLSPVAQRPFLTSTVLVPKKNFLI